MSVFNPKPQHTTSVLASEVRVFSVENWNKILYLFTAEVEIRFQKSFSHF